jgi:hypothetical protein
MPVTMTPSPESTKQTDRSTQELPEIPEADTIEKWRAEKVLRWIKQRYSNILEDDDLVTFSEARISGWAFLAGNVEFYQGCGLHRGVGLALKALADKVKERGKFIPRT